MRPGKTVSFRVSPTNCISIVQAAQRLGFQSTSFARATSYVLGALLDKHRLAGEIPTPTGFEYAETMAPYAGTGRPLNRPAEATDEDRTLLMALHKAREDGTMPPEHEGEYQRLMGVIYG